MTINQGLFGACLLALAALLCAPGAQGQVYKVVDKDGNVIFTDRPPEGAEPMELPELSVVERPEYQADSRALAGDAEQADQAPSLRELQRMYRGFRITSPEPEQSFWGTENTATIAWTAGQPLQPGMQVQISLNGQAFEPTTQTSMSTGRLDRGEHSVSAMLLDANGRTISRAGPVTFFIRQQTQGMAPRPRVGG